MKIHNFPGFFIDIEGLDGSGASTQVGLVSRGLKKLGLKPYLTKEPTEGPIGQLVCQALRGEWNSLPSASLQLLFAADRGRHLNEEIIPRLKQGEMVITDRYAWASVAFGSVNLSKEWLIELNRDFIFPDLTIFIDVEPRTCLKRLEKEKKGVELFDQEELLDEIWVTYQWLVSKYWWVDMAVVDGEKSKEKVTAEIMALLKKHSKFKKLC